MPVDDLDGVGPPLRPPAIQRGPKPSPRTSRLRSSQTSTGACPRPHARPGADTAHSSRLLDGSITSADALGAHSSSPGPLITSWRRDDLAVPTRGVSSGHQWSPQEPFIPKRFAPIWPASSSVDAPREAPLRLGLAPQLPTARSTRVTSVPPPRPDPQHAEPIHPERRYPVRTDWFRTPPVYVSAT